MKKLAIIIFVAALVIGLVVPNLISAGKAGGRFFNLSVNFGGVKGSGNVQTESREVSDFDAVDVGGVFQVEITAQKDFSVTVEADDNLLPLVKTTVEGNTLKIESDGKLHPTKPIVIRISAPDIAGLDVSGASSTTLIDVKNSALSVDASGASKIKISGETAKLTVDVSGATKINAEDLRSTDTSVDASGASGVTVNVSGELRADASGASNITYTGSPLKVEKSSHGASRVSQK
jgi:hypothetical protein